MIRDFASVVDALSAESEVTTGRMFGADGLKVGRHVFAMEVRGNLVVKLRPERASELRDTGVATSFDPGHGRPMKQWVAVAPPTNIDWLELSREALSYVRG